MGQSIGVRTEVLGTLVCLSPVHLGGWDNTAEASLTIARDGTGQPCLPGTSIAGALRAYLASLDRFQHDRSADLIAALFGHITVGGHGGSPSWIRVDDAHLIGDAVTPVVRDGVGIDRDSASAAANFLYTLQVLPAGTRFALRLVADTPTTAAPDYPGGWPALVRDAVDAMIGGLAHGRVPIGARRGSGLGRVELREVKIRRADLSSPAGLVAWLTGAAPALPVEPAKDTPPADGRLRITITWRPVNPLLVRDSLPGTVVDTLPLTDTTADGTVRLLLPGSSIRGVVRAHAERIVRTLRRRDDQPSFAETLRQPPPGLDVLFGSAPTGSRADRDDADAPGTESKAAGKGRRGVLAVADCRSVGCVSAKRWHDIVTVTPNPVDATGLEEREARGERNVERDQARAVLRARLADVDDRISLSVSDHVAIDRWTGGASGHRLFSVLDPATTVAWEPIRIDVDTARLDRYRADDPESAALAMPLLLLVLRDLRDGWLSLGYGGTRGHGDIEVTDVTFAGDGLSAPWQSLAGRTLDSILADPPPAVIDAMTTWENTFQEAAA